MASALACPRSPVVLLVIHDSQDVELLWIEHAPNQTVAVAAHIEYHAVANPIRRTKRLREPGGN